MIDELITPRLRLRRARHDDLAALHGIFRDPRAMRYWSTPPHEDLDQTRAWLDAMIDAEPACSSDFIVEHQGRVIGKAGCWRIPEIGYILHPDAWSKGFAREALSAVLPHIFETFGLDAVRADVDPRNTASLKLLHALGFEETGRAQKTIQVGDEWCDSVYLELARPS